MSGELLRRLLFTCQHQFSWPRQAEDGQHYQVCVHCGVTYRYDWSRMRRLARLPNGSTARENLSRHQCKARTCWTPRSRRLRHQVPVLLRAVGGDTWVEGATENISESGVLMRIPIDVTVGTAAELILEMPREITGRAATRVLTRALVTRTSRAQAHPENIADSYLVACSISDYIFIDGSQQIAG